MRSLIASVLLGLLIIWGSTAYTSGLEKISESLIIKNASVREYIKSEDYNQALYGIKDLRKSLEQNRGLLEMTGKHNETDEIEIGISELEVYTQAQKQDDALAKCSLIEFLLEHLPKNFKLRIENIL